MMIKKSRNFLLALLSGVLLSVSWFSPFTLLIFISLVPLLLLTSTIHKSQSKKRAIKIWALSYLSFFIWNLLSTWWIYNASFEGAVMAIVCNALLMSWVYLLWYKTERRIYSHLKFWLLIPFWLGWEYLHSLWDLTWTWLTLGNCFSNTTSLVQWFELTGVSGGSLWIIVVNVLFVNVLFSAPKKHTLYVKPLLSILIPVLISISIYKFRNFESEKQISVTIIQPNIDPYNTKFVFDFTTQLNQLHQQLLSAQLNRNSELVILPETFIMEDIRENDYKNSTSLNNLMALIKIHFPKASILTGASTYRVFDKGEKISSTARKFDDADEYYDMFSSAIYIDTARNISFYHKSKLVPGVERMPFPGFFKYFEKFAIELGGTSGSLATQKERTIFIDKPYNFSLAPAICYESVYGDFLTAYIRNGAEMISIITNDGWWGDTPGHWQHLAYAKLRAIETRKQIARCANTGISCFINEMGDIRQAQPYWEFAVIHDEIKLNSVKTFFVRFGDLLSYMSFTLALISLFYGQYLSFRIRKN